MKLFLSTYVFKIDKKGRISLPSSYRAILTEKNKIELILFKSFKYKSIEACGYNRIENIAKTIDQLDIFSDDQDNFTTSIFSELRSVNIDSEGRFLIPEDLKKYAQIRNEATFIGQGNSFQIWNPDMAASRQESSRKKLIEEKKTLKSLTSLIKNE
ncbi:MAG: Transcriptional regulator MraZ [Alphaproteobacteria bacterium MarineAlpha5_Bin11]|nr:division/cell wall cluster transcriptional repressor MraZ [Pelagibacteraceae bacterium]PPR43582.1 MAG: Transcriptional regulator MraZ [Alphaproteobacteria bacterium MarineAlpha5_Bin11]PPR51646.1 MAG: Transcriptional regulator MraZ [Alphaproteobacteria bacterium MarineAlpha5_Bin10]|tara:strand:- start:64 stop:531 length:468 start_codon:yes stop_codon:yes gene_type:complete